MLRLSKKADYALMAMKHLALQADRGSASAREIAQHYDIPVELLAKVLQRLVRRGLLASHQGTRGGYLLSRPAGAISVSEVIQAIDGPLTITACSSDDHGCDQYLGLQRARSALAHQRSNSRGARDLHGGGPDGGSAGGHTCDACDGGHAGWTKKPGTRDSGLGPGAWGLGTRWFR